MKDEIVSSLFLFFFVISCIVSLFFAVVLLIDNYREIEEKDNIITELKEKNRFLLNQGYSSIEKSEICTDFFHFEKSNFFK